MIYRYHSWRMSELTQHCFKKRSGSPALKPGPRSFSLVACRPEAISSGVCRRPRSTSILNYAVIGCDVGVAVIRDRVEPPACSPMAAISPPS